MHSRIEARFVTHRAYGFHPLAGNEAADPVDNEPGIGSADQQFFDLRSEVGQGTDNVDLDLTFLRAPYADRVAVCALQISLQSRAALSQFNGFAFGGFGQLDGRLGFAPCSAEFTPERVQLLPPAQPAHPGGGDPILIGNPSESFCHFSRREMLG